MNSPHITVCPQFIHQTEFLVKKEGIFAAERAKAVPAPRTDKEKSLFGKKPDENSDEHI
jgi:hypothetical protein